VLRRTVLLGLLGAALVPASAHAAVSLVKVGSFSHPVYVAAPPGDSHRLLVVEQGGTIRLVKDGVVQSTPFLDISSLVTNGWAVSSDPEQGMLSMAFAPDYATSHRFYVYYTGKHCPQSPGCDNVVATYTSDSSGDTASGPGTVLLTIPHPNEVNHNGGQLQFGPDGDLYISTGDGGGTNDSQHNAQQTTNLLGKILRISPGPSSYSIPPGNPFNASECSSGSNGGGNCPEIWSYGLRNPWRFSFDRLTGDMVIGDVGQDAWEEIDFAHPGQNAGANYGWPCFEGTHNGNPDDPSECTGVTTGDTTLPVFEYSHSCSTTPAFCGEGVIGGYVVRDPSIPELYGRYMYGDLSTSASKGLRSIVLGQPSASGDASVPVNVSGLSGFGEDAGGCVYAESVTNGGVWRIAPAGATNPGPCPVAAVTPPPTTAKDTTPALVKITRKRNQHVLKTHYIKITVSPNELATITARGTVNIPGAAKLFRTHTNTRQCLGGKKVSLRLRISKKTLGKVRRALRHRKFLSARITVTSTDASGNRSTPKHATVRLVR
jgi:glucose/arabinose dehydrogenase